MASGQFPPLSVSVSPLPVVVDESTTTVATSNASPITTATNTTMVAAAGAGNKIVVRRFHASNSHVSQAVTIALRSDTSGALYFATTLSPAGGSLSIPLDGAFQTVANEPLVLNTDAAGSIAWSVSYNVVAA